MGQDVQAGCAAESGGSWTLQSPGPHASSLGKVASAGESDTRKEMAALGAPVLNDVEPQLQTSYWDRAVSPSFSAS